MNNSSSKNKIWQLDTLKTELYKCCGFMGIPGD